MSCHKECSLRLLIQCAFSSEPLYNFLPLFLSFLLCFALLCTAGIPGVDTRSGCTCHHTTRGKYPTSYAGRRGSPFSQARSRVSHHFPLGLINGKPTFKRMKWQAWFSCWCFCAMFWRSRRGSGILDDWKERSSQCHWRHFHGQCYAGQKVTELRLKTLFN